MADIKIETNEVSGIVSEIDKMYEELFSKISELNHKKENVASFWNSKEATTFINQLDKVSKMFEDFDTEYNNFVLSLNNFIKMYNEEEDSILSSINNYSEH